MTLCKEVERVQRKAEKVESATDVFKRKKAEGAKRSGMVFDNGITDEPEKVQKVLTKVVEDAVKSALGIDVNVSGRIEIVFKLGGGDGR